MAEEAAVEALAERKARRESNDAFITAVNLYRKSLKVKNFLVGSFMLACVEDVKGEK